MLPDFARYSLTERSVREVFEKCYGTPNRANWRNVFSHAAGQVQRKRNPVTLWFESGNIERDRKQHAPRDRSSSAERNRKLDLFVSVMMILRHRLKRQ